ncbi:hypothetical protein [Novipirellula caenicola]|uniref:hypothetical protein n=1 Tax=Novipirellula caenicola TaxID=1536901 RepID=UPI0031EFCBA8
MNGKRHAQADQAIHNASPTRISTRQFSLDATAVGKRPKMTYRGISVENGVGNLTC